MGVLYFGKVQKARTTEEHNSMYVADGLPPGAYVSNMTDKDLHRWRAKHVKGDNERVEIRRTVSGSQLVIVVYKSFKHKNEPGVAFSCNGKLHFSLDLYIEAFEAVKEACVVMRVDFPDSVPSMDGKRS